MHENAEARTRDLVEEMVNARRVSGMRQIEVASASGVTQPYLSLIENHKAMPTLKTMLRLLNSMGKTLRVVDA